MKIISLWSGPRNVSTALMYSFAQRPDMKVLDEPLYAHYLSRTDAGHPGEQEVLEHMEHNGALVMKNIKHTAPKSKHLFIKNMAHHWVGLDYRLLDDILHVFLIRDPKEMLPSLAQKLQKPALRDTGLKVQVDLYQHLESKGIQVPIIGSKQLLLNPEKVLTKVCEHLNIPFCKEMLSWKKGARPEDGIWAKHWYQNVHQSTGFSAYRPKKDFFPDHLRPLLEECQPYYTFLKGHALIIE